MTEQDWITKLRDDNERKDGWIFVLGYLLFCCSAAHLLTWLQNAP